MKLCWDNIDKLKYSIKTGKWYRNNTTYNYKDSCIICKEPFLTQNTNSIACSNSCITKTKEFKDKCSFNGKKLKGIKKSKEHIKNISISKKGVYKGKNNPMYGKKHTKETIKLLSNIATNSIGEKSSNWKGGYNNTNIPTFDSYSYQIDFCEETRRSNEDKNVLEVRCKYCNKWYIPKKSDIRNRIQSLKTNKGGSHLYCSGKCQNNCDIYGKIKYPKGYRKYKYSREVQPALRKLVLERDDWTCQKCSNDKDLHCHHFEGIQINPIESADVDNCITLCKECHKKVHKQDGCRYNDLKCNKKDLPIDS